MPVSSDSGTGGTMADSGVSPNPDASNPTDTGLIFDVGMTPDAGLIADAGEADPCPSDYTQPEFPSTYIPVENTISPMQLDGQPSNTWIRPTVEFSTYGPRDGQARNQLFILLPGTNGTPQRASWVMRAASYLGYHVIGLAFANNGSVSQMCSTLSTPEEQRLCHGQVIRERIYGDDGTSASSPLVSVDEKNSVIGRLKLVLDYQILNDSFGNWEQFVKAGEPDWSKIVVSGASQGGKTATYISRDFEVARAVLFNAMGSAFRGDTPNEVIIGEWSREPRQTGPGRVFGLWHKQEAADAYAPILLESYGVDSNGDTHDVDNSSPPFQCSHMLRTDLEPADAQGCNAHASVAADDCSAKDSNGIPMLMPTYMYMMNFPTTE